ncbi:MAG: FAD-dependent oxidoreductase [Burkholderiaceae bacterium]
MIKHIVLVGGGHAHAGVLRLQAENRLIGAQITVISPSKFAAYSGMLPGWMAGHYTWQEICLNFEALAAKAGARFIEGTVQSLDLAAKQLHLHDGTVVAFDVLSLNIGSTHRPPVQGDVSAVLPLRPLGDLMARTQEFVEQYRQTQALLSVMVVGAGGAGFEMALAVQHSLKKAYPGRELRVSIVTDGSAPLPTHSKAVQRMAANVLHEHGVELMTNTVVEKIEGHHVYLRTNALRPAPEQRALPPLPSAGEGWGEGALASTATTITHYAEKIIWAGGAQPHLWPQQSGLALDARGFIEVNAALQSTSHPFVFASGDCAGFDPPLPKAGVYPVRQGPLLTRNLAAAASDTPLSHYTPQRHALGLFATGPKHAIASYGPLALSGEWVWRWKDRIDRAFIQKHSA